MLLKWLKNNAIPISIDPMNEDFTDLKQLKNVIGDADVVLLGEQTHGDGATFETKCRLIKFLHKEMGFDVLAFESGFYSCNKANNRIIQGEKVRVALQKSISSMWSKAKEFEPIIDYIEKSSQTLYPLEVCGFDCQNTEAYGKGLEQDIEAYFKERNIEFQNADILNTRGMLFLRKYENIALFNRFDTLKQKILSKIQDTDSISLFWRQCMSTHSTYAIESKRFSDDSTNIKANMLRDSLMAENFIWLKKYKYANKKIIVWAASMHNARRRHELVDSEKKREKYPLITFGDILNRRLNAKKIYNLGFSSAEGYWAWIGHKDSFKLSPIKQGSFEDLALKAGLTNAFVNFNNVHESHWLNYSLDIRLLGDEFQRSIWTRHLDGICFIKESKRAHLSLK